jgi:hypothetical protein
VNSQDISNFNNDRGALLQLLIEYCADQNLPYRYTEKDFIIPLPSAEALPLATERAKKKTKRIDPNEFEFLRPDPNGVIEGLPDELPPTTTPLEEGEPPKGDDEV